MSISSRAFLAIQAAYKEGDTVKVSTPFATYIVSKVDDFGVYGIWSGGFFPKDIDEEVYIPHKFMTGATIILK